MRRQRQRDRPLTAAEIEALRFIARQQGIDLAELVREQGLADRVEGLTARQVDQVLYLLPSRRPSREEGGCSS